MRSGSVGSVLALYRLERDAFTATHLSVLQASRQELGAAIAEDLNQTRSAADPMPEVAHALGPHLVGASRTPRPF